MYSLFFYFFFHHPSSTVIYTLSLHDALPIFVFGDRHAALIEERAFAAAYFNIARVQTPAPHVAALIPMINKTYTVARSEEHTSELQSRLHLVCRLLLEKKKKKIKKTTQNQNK